MWRQLKHVISNILTSTFVLQDEVTLALKNIHQLETNGYSGYLKRQVKLTLDKHARRLSKELRDSDSPEVFNDKFRKFSKRYARVCDIVLKGLRDEVDIRPTDEPFKKIANQTWQTEVLQPIATLIARVFVDSFKDGDRLQDLYFVSYNTTMKASVFLSIIKSEEEQRDPESNLYSEYFEKPLVEGMSECYRKYSVEQLQELGPVKYMKKALQRLEGATPPPFMKQTTLQKLDEAFVEHYIMGVKDEILSECARMFNEERESDLSTLYQFLKRVPNHDFSEMKTHFGNQVEKRVLASIASLQGTDGDRFFIKKLLQTHTRCQEMVVEIFENNRSFLTVLEKTFLQVIRQKSPNLASMLAEYCNSILHKSNRHVSEERAQQLAEHALVTLYPCIYDEAMFKKEYARFLANRLIRNASKSMDVELHLLVTLFQALTCGSEYMNKLKTMLTEVGFSEQLIKEFNQQCNACIQFSVKIAKSDAWDLHNRNSPTFTLPLVIKNVSVKFTEFYSDRFGQHKLTWNHLLSRSEVQINVGNKEYLVTMNTFQLAILLLFQDRDKIGFDEIMDALKTDRENLSKYINTLVESKLISEVKALSYEFNTGYKNILPKFEISGVSKSATPVEIDCTYFLECAIVRVMKQHKKMSHDQLVTEVLAMTNNRFPIKMLLFKSVIECLIESEYLERMPEDNSVYLYIE